MRAERVSHEFVEFIPAEVPEATLYISIPYATVVHLCLCGCGERVVTPLSPTDWRLIFDGETVSLNPSVGNWNFECRSHYVIKRNRVLWAGRWSQAKIEAGRDRDRRVKQKHFGELTTIPEEASPRTAAEAAPRANWLGRWLARLRG